MKQRQAGTKTIVDMGKQRRVEFEVHRSLGLYSEGFQAGYAKGLKNSVKPGEPILEAEMPVEERPNFVEGYNDGYHEGYAQGCMNNRKNREPASGARKPVSIRVMSKYPEDEQDWSPYRVWCVDFTSGPAEYWVVGYPTAGHMVVASSHGTLDEALAARSGMGHGVGQP